jgi:hypothetical protein
MVDAGEDAFDDESIGILLGGAAAVVELLAQSDCDSFVS